MSLRSCKDKDYRLVSNLVSLYFKITESFSEVQNDILKAYIGGFYSGFEEKINSRFREAFIKMLELKLNRD